MKKVHKIVQDFQLKIVAYQKVYLIPSPPRKPSPIFIQLLNLERPKLEHLSQTHSSADLISMMSQEWKIYDPVRKAQLQKQYDRELILYFQNMQKYKRMFDSSIRVLSKTQQYQRILMSEQFKHVRNDDDDKEQQMKIIRQKFGNLQTSLQNTQKNITQQDKRLVEQLIHLKTLFKQQILSNYLYFKIPNFLLNSFGKSLSNHYFHTYIRQYEKVPDIQFQQYLVDQSISENCLQEYLNQLKYLSKQLNCPQENVELALIFHMNYKKKKIEQQKEKQSDFLELVQQEMGSIDIE